MRSEVRLNRNRIVLAIVFSLIFSGHEATAFPRKTVPAKAAVVIDASGTVLFAKYPKARLAPASTVKLMTAMVAIDLLKVDALVLVSRSASQVRTIPPGLCPDEEMTVSDLLHLSLMKSINSAAVALAEAAAGSEEAFAAMMNKKAQEIGARDTLFANASGLPKGVQYSTASDLARIMQAALSYPLIREILAKKEWVVWTHAGREIHLENSKQLLWQEQTTIIGKTGYTGNARHCFVGMMETESGPVFTVVLGARSRTSLWRATTMLAEVGVNPGLADMLETSAGRRAAGKATVMKSKSTAERPRQDDAEDDIRISRLLRISSQLLGNN